MLAGLSVGIPTGFILHRVAPKFVYSDVLALGAACWTVAVLNLFAGKLVGYPEESHLLALHGSYKGYSGTGPDQEWSQAELQGLHDTISLLPKEQRLPVDPSSDFGKHIKLVLVQRMYTNLPKLASRAFPNAEKLLDLTRQVFQDQTIRVELVTVSHFSKYDKAMRAVSSCTKGTIKLMVGCETKVESSTHDPLAAIYQE